MESQPTAPVCIVEGCDEVSALSATARGLFFSFTTFYCSRHYERAMNGERPKIEIARLIVEPLPLEQATLGPLKERE